MAFDKGLTVGYLERRVLQGCLHWLPTRIVDENVVVIRQCQVSRFFERACEMDMPKPKRYAESQLKCDPIPLVLVVEREHPLIVWTAPFPEFILVGGRACPVPYVAVTIRSAGGIHERPTISRASD